MALGIPVLHLGSLTPSPEHGLMVGAWAWTKNLGKHGQGCERDVWLETELKSQCLEKKVLYLAQVPTKGMSNDPKAVSCTSICCHGSRVYPRVAPVTNGISFGPSDFVQALELAAQLHQTSWKITVHLSIGGCITLRSCQGYAITYHIKLPEFMVYIAKLPITFQVGGLYHRSKLPMTVQHQVSTAEILLQLWDLQTYRGTKEPVGSPEQSGMAGKLWKD